MNLSQLAAIAMLAAFGALLSACGGDPVAADEAAIREINKKWHELIVAKDAKAIAALYAEDGQLLPPNMPKVVGREALEKGWQGYLGMPGMSLTWNTEKIVVAKSGDVAVETQTYTFASANGGVETGKSVVTWVKRNGQWVVFTDMMSADAAALPAPPAVPVPALEADAPPTDPTAVPTEAPTTPPAQ